MDEKKHFVVATGIIVRDGKYLIVKRADWEKAFPGRWTVPGGKLEPTDYTARDRDAAELWYNVLEDLVRREVKEEVNLEMGNLDYLTSMTYIRPDGMPSIIISLYGDHAGGELKLCDALTGHAWVTLEEAKEYDLIDGIYEELEMLDCLRNTGERKVWSKK